jgi:hypothetical protein
VSDSKESSLLFEDEDQVSDFLNRVILENNNISDDESYLSLQTSGKPTTKVQSISMTPKLKSQSGVMMATSLFANMANNTTSAK